MNRWQKGGILCLLVVVVIGVAWLTIAIVGGYRRVRVAAPLASNPSSTPQPTLDPLRPRTVLVMGYGGGSHAGGRLTDTMIVIHLDPRHQRVALISLPRDIWIEYPLEQPAAGKLNAAYAIGGDDRRYPHKPAVYSGESGAGELAKSVASRVVGFPIEFFVAIDFAGFVEIIDRLGGAEVRVQTTFDDYHYPIAGKEDDVCELSEEDITALTATLSATQLESAFPCRYEHLHFDAGLEKMDGERALKFVRSRHGVPDGGDFGRAARQRALLQALKNRLVSPTIVPKLIPLMETLSNHLRTDIPLSVMQTFALDYQTYVAYQITGITLSDQNVLRIGRSHDGQFILLPRQPTPTTPPSTSAAEISEETTSTSAWQSVHQWLQTQLNDESLIDN